MRLVLYRVVYIREMKLIGVSLREPNTDGTAGRFHILWYDHHPRTVVGRTKYVELP